jgi:hypothetical protein
MNKGEHSLDLGKLFTTREIKQFESLINSELFFSGVS